MSKSCSHPKETRTCEWCGNQFVIVLWPSLPPRRGRFCSRACLGHMSNRKHGKSVANDATYRVWCGMRNRTATPSCSGYERYGGRKIKVCKRWLESFENFLADMGSKPEGMSLDRIDNNGNYSPDNCRWATRSEQMRNTRGNNLLTYGDRTQCVAAWIEESNVNPNTFRQRLRSGWSADKIFEPPVKNKRGSNGRYLKRF